MDIMIQDLRVCPSNCHSEGTSPKNLTEIAVISSSLRPQSRRPEGNPEGSMVETLRLSPQGDTACRILRLLAQNDGKPVSPNNKNIQIKKIIASIIIAFGVFFTGLMLLNVWNPTSTIRNNLLINKIMPTAEILSVAFLVLLAVLKLIETKNNS